MVLDAQPLTPEACPQLGRLKIRISRRGSTYVITLIGELDVAGASELGRDLRGLDIAEGAVLAIDLRELTFIGSAGIAALIHAARRAAARGYRLIVVNDNPATQRVFDICGLGGSLPLVAALPSGAAKRPSAAAPRRSRGGPSTPSARAAARRRVAAAALAAAVRELRTHRRPHAPA